MAVGFGREILAGFIANVIARRGAAGADLDGAGLALISQAERDQLIQLARALQLPIRMHVRGRFTIPAGDVGQWIKLAEAYPRTKLMIQNKGTGASPNVGTIYYRDTQGQSGDGATDGIQILPDGHLWDEEGAHQGEVWINGDTAGIRVQMIEWGVEET